MGTLAARLAFVGREEPGKHPDKNGALHTVANQPFGRALLAVLAAGFLAMVVWSVAELVRKRDGERTNHLQRRAVGAGRAAIYAALAWSTLKLVLGSGNSGGNRQEAFTAQVLGWPGGRVLVGAAAAALVGAAAYNVNRAVTRKFEDHWDRSRMDARARRIAAPAEAAGNFGHAAVFALVGWFLALAAIRFDPNEPKSLDESLAVLAHASYGRPICLAVAAGMVAWALNAIAQAMWRKIPAD